MTMLILRSPIFQVKEAHIANFSCLPLGAIALGRLSSMAWLSTLLGYKEVIVYPGQLTVACLNERTAIISRRERTIYKYEESNCHAIKLLRFSGCKWQRGRRNPWSRTVLRHRHRASPTHIPSLAGGSQRRAPDRHNFLSTGKGV